MQTIFKRNSFLLVLSFVCVVALCAGALVLTGCNTDQAPEESTDQETIEFVDSCGRTVELPANIERIAVSGSLTQQAIIPIAADKMVGISSDFEDEELKYLGQDLVDLPKFGQIYGSKSGFNEEAVAAANPQVIIDAGQPKKSIAEDMDALQEATGIPCIHIDANPGQFDETYMTLGKLLGEEERGKELADYAAQSHKKVLDIMANVDDAERVKVLYIAGADGTMVKANGSFDAQVVDEICDNVAKLPEGEKLRGRGNEVGFEQIANWNPEMIIFTPESIYNQVSELPEWNTLSAIADHNFYQAPNGPYNWLGDPVSVNTILGEQWLVELCYPEKSDIELNETVKTYYKTFYNYDLTDEEVDELLSTGLRNTAA